MSASSAASMARTAGRGAALRAPPRSMPTEIASSDESRRSLGLGRGSKLSQNVHRATPHMNDQPIRRRPNGSARSAFAAAVLDRRGRQDSNNRLSPRQWNRESFEYKKNDSILSGIWQNDARSSAAKEAAAAARERARAEWFAAAEKPPQLASIESRATADRSSQDSSVPFAWGNLSSAVDHLPKDHWAVSYLHGAAHSLETNSSLSASQKRIMLTQLMQSLATISRIESHPNSA